MKSASWRPGLSRLAVCAAVVFVVPAARADEDLEQHLVSAKQAYQAAITKAEEALAAAFDGAEDAVRKSGRSPEEKQQVLDRLRQEKSDFEQHGWYPWSARLRPALAVFIRDRAAAEKSLSAKFDKAIDAYTRGRRDAEAAAFLKMKKETIAPKLVARWEITGVNWKGSWIAQLYSNGHYGEPFGKAVWTFNKGVLTLTQPEAGSPRGIKVLRWQLKDSGAECDEVGNKGTTSTGKLINSAETK